MSYPSSTVPKEHWKVKNRKAFAGTKAWLDRTHLKKGVSDKKRNSSLEVSRIKALEERKKASKLYYLMLFLLIFIMSIGFAGFIVNLIFTTPPPVYKVKPVVHGSPAVEMNRMNLPFLERGYQAWQENEIELAIVWFNQADDKTDDWWGKELALVGLYNYACKNDHNYCEIYEFHKYRLYEDYKERRPKDSYAQFLRYVKSYNDQMFKYLGYDPIE